MEWLTSLEWLESLNEMRDRPECCKVLVMHKNSNGVFRTSKSVASIVEKGRKTRLFLIIGSLTHISSVIDFYSWCK